MKTNETTSALNLVLFECVFLSQQQTKINLKQKQNEKKYFSLQIERIGSKIELKKIV